MSAPSAALEYLKEIQSQAYLDDEARRRGLNVENFERHYVQTAQRMSERAVLDRLLHPPSGTRPGVEAIPEMRAALDAANVPPERPELPTEFQDPNDYKILMGLRKRIMDTTERTGVMIPPGLVLGTVPMGDVEARTHRFANGEYLIVLREGVFSFVHVLATVLLAAMEMQAKDGTTYFTSDLAQIEANVAGKPDLVQRLRELLEAGLIKGNAWYAPRHPLPPSYVGPLQLLINAGELFVLCHELAHIQLKHFAPDAARTESARKAGISESFLCEYQADQRGMEDALVVMGTNFSVDAGQAGYGIMVLLTGLDLYERARSHIPNAEASRPDLSHPAYPDRRAAIMKIWAGYPKLSEPLLKGAELMQGALEALWAEFAKAHPAVA